MWPFGRKRRAESPADPGVEAEGAPDTPRSRRGKLKRRAGCLWGLLTEPIFLVVITLAAVIFGRTYLVGRARRLRLEDSERREHADE